MTDHPHARSDDGQESHEAAESVGQLTAKQSAVYRLVSSRGPLTDSRLVEIYLDQWRERGWPEQSESGIRTRRHELVVRGDVEKGANRAQLPTGRWAATWQVVDPA